MRLALDSIYVGRRVRKDYGFEELQRLADDLKENGQIQPIAVRPVSDYDKAEPEWAGQPYSLIAGGRRYMASGIAGFTDIEAYEREEMAELTHRVLELHENLLRKPMNWQEEVEGKAEILRLRKIENPNIKDWEVAREIGDNAASFSRDVATAQTLKDNPGLKKATSKKAALNAGKELKRHEARQILQASAAKVVGVVDAAPPIEDRIKTALALDFVKGLPKHSIDLALLDGPYAYDFWKLGQKGKRTEHLSKYDDSPQEGFLMYEELLPELVRVIRPTGWLVMFAGHETYQFFERELKELCRVHCGSRFVNAEGDEYNRCNKWFDGDKAEPCIFLRPEPFPCYWYRPNSRNQPRYGHLHPWNVVEQIFVCNMGRGRIVDHPMPNIFIHEADYGNERIHANQKPLALGKDIIKHFTFTGDSVLDCFAGSGNFPAAAASLGRVAYACDKNPEMLPFIRGRVQELTKPVSADDIKASHDRYIQRLTEPQEAPSE